jgi:predicted N-formylglutamate amidohydrolase
MKPDRTGNVALVVSCEHGGNRVPGHFAELFRGRKRLLESHRGYDHGALELAGAIAVAFGAPIFSSEVTRLLVDFNSSPDSRNLFSEISRGLTTEEKAEVLRRFYHPYRLAVEMAVAGLTEAGRRVVHISVHSFTPELSGKIRNADLGLLYDPSRIAEREFCGGWLKELSLEAPRWLIRRNYPYRGTSDGLTTALRRRFSGGSYLGIELEINQRHLRKKTDLPLMARIIVDSLKNACGFSKPLSTSRNGKGA